MSPRPHLQTTPSSCLATLGIVVGPFFFLLLFKGSPTGWEWYWRITDAIGYPGLILFIFLSMAIPFTAIYLTIRYLQKPHKD